MKNRRWIWIILFLTVVSALAVAALSWSTGLVIRRHMTESIVITSSLSWRETSLQLPNNTLTCS